VYIKKEKEKKEINMAEFNNRSVYKNGKGCRNIPLITLLQKFLYIMVLLKEYKRNS
jgi:hypothetical protein